MGLGGGRGSVEAPKASQMVREGFLEEGTSGLIHKESLGGSQNMNVYTEVTSVVRLPIFLSLLSSSVALVKFPHFSFGFLVCKIGCQ